MFEFVDAMETRPYRSACSNALKELCLILKAKEITAQYTFIGSGAKNMVTRNGNGPFDLDYNLEIIKMSDEYQHDLRYLKDTVRVSLDKATGSQYFSTSKDSTSCLTALLHFKDKSKVRFSFDVAIVTRNSKGTLRRLIHNKRISLDGHDQYIWDDVPRSHNVGFKAGKLKAEGFWGDVRERYIDLKNLHLQSNDKNHPSFIVYIEAVNQVYDEIFR